MCQLNGRCRICLRPLCWIHPSEAHHFIYGCNRPLSDITTNTDFIALLPLWSALYLTSHSGPFFFFSYSELVQLKFPVIWKNDKAIVSESGGAIKFQPLYTKYPCSDGDHTQETNSTITTCMKYPKHQPEIRVHQNMEIECQLHPHSPSQLHGFLFITQYPRHPIKHLPMTRGPTTLQEKHSGDKNRSNLAMKRVIHDVRWSGRIGSPSRSDTYRISTTPSTHEETLTSLVEKN